MTDEACAITLGDVLTAVVRARCLEAVTASALARRDGDDVAQLAAGVRS